MAESVHSPAPPVPLREEVFALFSSRVRRGDGLMDRARRMVFALLLALACAAPAAPQVPAPEPGPTPTPAVQEDAGSDPYGRETPRGSFFGFLKAAERENYANAAEYLQLPPSLRPQREQIASQFQGSRVRFARLGTSSLEIDVFAHVRADAYPTFLAVQEALLLRVLEIVEAAGTSVAFPSQTVYLRRDGSPDAGKEGQAL